MVAQPGHFHALIRELVLGPGAPEFGDPNSTFPADIEGLDAETLEVHAVGSWIPKGFPKLLVVLDADGLGKGLKANPRATYLLNGGSDPGTEEGMVVHGPAIVLADWDSDAGDDVEQQPPEFDKDCLMRLLQTRGKGSLDSLAWETALGDPPSAVEFNPEPEGDALADKGSDDDEEMVEVTD